MGNERKQQTEADRNREIGKRETESYIDWED